MISSPARYLSRLALGTSRRVARPSLISSASVYERLGRFNSSSAGAPKPKTLDEWIANPPTLEGLDCLHHEHLGDVFVTLPTRDGSRQAFQEAKPGVPLGYGHHLAFFHHRKPEWLLREDGTEDDISPPDPFITRMWAGGKIKFDVDNPLIVGTKTRSKHHVKEALKKGFEKGRPMVFVTQEIAYTMEGKTSPSVVEERQHVFLPEGRVVRKEPRVVPDIPTTADFSFTYKPTPVTLFRFSSLMFNAHHIHLDKDYTTQVEGYPERLVHGPMTAIMLLEALVFNYPMAHIKEFEYRATNPLYVNRDLTIKGSWLDSTTAKVWCEDDQGTVGMRGTIKIAA